MENLLFLDTHVVVWLYDKALSRFSARARRAIEEHQLLISPLVMLELEYLFEIDRINVSAMTIIDFLERRIELRVDENVKMSHLFITSLQEKWTRDPFDRLIVSHAKAKGLPLLSNDKSIKKNYPKAFW
jgi:PIN domain nuclease of toxin-antitoxin system